LSRCAKNKKKTPPNGPPVSGWSGWEFDFARSLLFFAGFNRRIRPFEDVILTETLDARKLDSGGLLKSGFPLAFEAAFLGMSGGTQTDRRAA